MTDERLFKQIVEALRQSEARYRHLTEHATDIIYTHTLDGRLITTNQAAERVLGYEREEFIGKNILDLIVPEHRALARRMTEEKVLAGGGATTYTVDVLTKSGQRLSLEVNTQIIFDEGAPLAVQGMARNVTERQREAQELSEREHFFRVITESSTDVIAILAADGLVHYVSPSFQEVLGHPPDVVLNTSGLQLVHPDDVQAAQQMLTEVTQQKGGFGRGEYRLRDAAGEYRYMDVRVRNLLADPIIRGIAVDARDVSDRRRAEQALRASEERFRKILETTGEGIVLRDTEGYITFVNERFGQMLGYTVDELLGRHVREIITPDHIPLQRASEERRKRTRMAESLDMRFVRKDGSIMEAILSVSPTFDEGGDYTGALAMITDVTERKRLEQQLRQSQKMEAVGRLAGGVAHDFNNLLTAIRGHTDLLLSDLPADSALRSDIEEIRGAADRAASLTQQLLAFSRRQMLQPVVLEVDSIIAAMQPLLARLLPRNVVLSTRLDAAETRVRADRSQIEQVLVNLVVNARDAMPNGGELRIVTEPFVMDASFARANPGSSPGAYARISVRDTGVGMDAQTLLHIFEPFFTTKDVGKGSGLGLATVYGIVKQSGGFVRASSAVGAGTEFEIFLPRVSEPVRDSRDAPVHANGTSGETILVAEDEPAVRALTCRILRKRGYHVLEAKDGTEAVEVASSYEGTINLLVTDVIMPNVGGRELSERLARMRPQVKVLFMSGYTDDQLLQRGVLQSGSGNFLEKPFTPDALARKVREVLDS
jgi:two-component system cell cycle sensor histidine kinase/response regulator CckA